ncbi:reverse transcriptase [Corchorus olitorius]|uniref:Reverse transcriptase n=1 Tax=Corchorus olitorius TaxID=93759 RepID=A0A1R3KJY5_9ROSI|nr:reverse transcriptase [Corchorus olitorius]
MSGKNPRPASSSVGKNSKVLQAQPQSKSLPKALCDITNVSRRTLLFLWKPTSLTLSPLLPLLHNLLPFHPHPSPILLPPLLMNCLLKHLTRAPMPVWMCEDLSPEVIFLPEIVNHFLLKCRLSRSPPPPHALKIEVTLPMNQLSIMESVQWRDSVLSLSNTPIQNLSSMKILFWNVLWRDNLVDVLIEEHFFQAVTISVKANNKSWDLSVVYGSPIPGNREELWRYMKEKSDSSSRPWALGGDFNSIASSADKSNFNSRDVNRCRKFQEKIMFPEAVVHHLPRIKSDHCPILLDLNGQITPRPALRPFRFEAAWLSHKHFKDFLGETWNHEQGNIISKLDQIIQGKVLEHKWKTVKASRGGHGVSHIFFADDLVLFSQANTEQVAVVKDSLDIFSRWSGQTVSLVKSKIFITKNTPRRLMNEICEASGIARTDDLGRYLGVPLLHGRVAKKTYWGLVEKVQSRLASWKVNHLSIAASHTWKSILKAGDLLSGGLKWRVGDGSKISFWYDKWLLDDSNLASFLHLVPNLGAKDILVSEFIDEEGWMVNKLLDYIPSFLIARVINIPVNLFSKLSDCIIWCKTSNGNFTTKSAFQSLNAHLPCSSPCIKAIWKIKVQPKIQNFLWLATQNRILGNDNRMIRSFTTDPSCSICGHHSESVLHILRDCTNAKVIWDILMISSKFSSSRSLNLEEWVNLNVISYKDEKFGDWSWPSLFANTYADANTKCKVKQVVHLSWEKPKEQWLKLNVDGSWNQQKNIAAAGGVFRNSQGNWIGGFGANMGNCSIDIAEMWAIYYGVKFAVQLNLNFVEIETDSCSSVQAITGGVDPHHPLFPLVKEIKDMLNESWTWSLKFIPREKNMLADWVAKWSCLQRPGLQNLSRPPAGCNSLILADSLGISYPRIMTM